MRNTDEGRQLYAPDTPPTVPLDQQPLAAFVQRELAKLAGVINLASHYEILHVAPSKTKPGDVIFADGVDYNPGRGEGLYRRNVANAAWVFIA